MSNWAELYPTFSDANQARLQRPLTDRQQRRENPAAYPLGPEATKISATWYLANAQVLWNLYLDEADTFPAKNALTVLEECAVQALLATKKTRTPAIFQSAIELLIQIERRRIDIVLDNSDVNFAVIEANIRYQLDATRNEFIDPTPSWVGQPSKKMAIAEKILASHSGQERYRQVIPVLAHLLEKARKAWANIDVETIIIPLTRDVSVDVRLVPNPVNEDIFVEFTMPGAKAKLIAKYAYNELSELRLTWELNEAGAKPATITEMSGLSSVQADQLAQFANWLDRALERINRFDTPMHRLMTVSRKLTPEEEKTDLEARLENFKAALLSRKLPGRFEWLNGSLNQAGIKAKWVLITDTQTEALTWALVNGESQRPSSRSHLTTYEQHVSAKLYILPEADELDTRHAVPQAMIDLWVRPDDQKMEDYQVGFFSDERTWREVKKADRVLGLTAAGDVVTSCRLLVEGSLPKPERRTAKKTEPLPTSNPQVRGKV